MNTLLTLPPGKITVRHRQMRNVWQCFAGRTYLSGASSDSPEEAVEQLLSQYDVPQDLEATVHGFREPFKLSLNPTE